MTEPKTPYEQASYNLNKFRERRMADRRFTPRGTPDRRVNRDANQATREPAPQVDEPKPDAP